MHQALIMHSGRPLCRDGVTGQQFLVQHGCLRLTLPPLDGVVLV